MSHENRVTNVLGLGLADLSKLETIKGTMDAWTDAPWTVRLARWITRDWFDGQVRLYILRREYRKSRIIDGLASGSISFDPTTVGIDLTHGPMSTHSTKIYLMHEQCRPWWMSKLERPPISAEVSPWRKSDE